MKASDDLNDNEDIDFKLPKTTSAECYSKILPIDQIRHLKKQIDAKLRSDDIYSLVRQVITEYVTKEKQEQHDKVIDVVLEKKVVQQILESMDSVPNLSSLDRNSLFSLSKPTIQEGYNYLQLRLLSGKAFLDYSRGFQRKQSLIPGNPCRSFFRLHIAFRGQRFRSMDVPCCTDPQFDDTFLLDLHSKVDLSSHTDRTNDNEVESLFGKNDPILLILTEVSQYEDLDQTEVSSFLAYYKLEWRKTLECGGGLSVHVELSSGSKEGNMKIPIGILHIRMDILPEYKNEEDVVSFRLAKQLQSEMFYESEAHRRFYYYAKNWWQEFSQISPAFKHRMVKLFAEDETHNYRSVCTFVIPLKTGRVLESSNAACRFVSLIPYTRREAVGGGRDETWHSIETFLALGTGDCEDHANLLASLLLGFGLDAYVCVGTIQDKETNSQCGHVWVMTRQGTSKNRKIVFWESLRGQKYIHSTTFLHATTILHATTTSKENGEYPYQTVGCVYNHESFYGNKQIDDRLSTCCFDLENEKMWKPMKRDILGKLSRQQPIGLIPPQIDASQEEIIEKELRKGVTCYRSQHGLGTKWDTNLEYIISPALLAYELNRCDEKIHDNDEFQDTIKRAVPEGYTFKGFPIMLTYKESWKILNTLENGTLSKSILLTSGDQVKFSIRIKIFSYPENTFALWLMLCVTYQEFEA